MQPNIVFIMADQLAAAFIGCYRSGVDSTPTLDRLAREGMRFDRCYAHVAVCAPNRATIFTGRSAEIHGVVNNNLALTTDNPTFAQVLRSQGYRTGGFGKFHSVPHHMPPPADFNYLGFDESVPSEDTKLGPWLDWIEREHPNYFQTALAVSWETPYLSEYGKAKRNLKPAWDKAHEAILAPLKRNSEWSLMYTSPLPKELHQTTYITDLSLDFIGRHQQHHADQPFFCFVSYVDPHDPYDPPQPYDTMFQPDQMPNPLPMNKHQRKSAALESSRSFHDFNSLELGALKKLRALYHGSIRFIDDQIKRILLFLEQQKLMENTILVFTTDHGDMMGDHGLITKGIKHYDASIRCPLIVRGPGIRNGVTNRLTSSLDFFPTFCDWSGIENTVPVEGKSFAQSCKNPDANDGWDVVTVRSAVRAPGTGTASSIVTEDGWRLSIFDEHNYGEMFNLLQDPEEQDNLYWNHQWVEKRLQLHELHARACMTASMTPHYRNLPRTFTEFRTNGT